MTRPKSRRLSPRSGPLAVVPSGYPILKNDLGCESIFLVLPVPVETMGGGDDGTGTARGETMGGDDGTGTVRYALKRWFHARQGTLARAREGLTSSSPGSIRRTLA